MHKILCESRTCSLYANIVEHCSQNVSMFWYLHADGIITYVRWGRLVRAGWKMLNGLCEFEIWWEAGDESMNFVTNWLNHYLGNRIMELHKFLFILITLNGGASRFPLNFIKLMMDHIWWKGSHWLEATSKNKAPPH